MDIKQVMAMCALSSLLGACVDSAEHARVLRNEATADAENTRPVAELEVVRPTYGLSYRMPPRDLPYYICPQQRMGMELLDDTAKASYKSFCRQSTYPHTLETWSNKSLLSRPGERSVVIRLCEQRGILFVDGKPALDFPVCTGSTERPTPTGGFCVLQKDMNHHSNLYDNAPMFCFMRLTWDGVGMHIGPMAGHPVSHGCIRLPESACRKLYNTLPMGARVTILP